MGEATERAGTPVAAAVAAAAPSAARTAASGDPVAAARAQVAGAREAFGAEIDELDSAARSAFDVKAKIKESPAKAAGLVGGAAFLAAGGPKRVLRGVVHRVRGTPAPKSLLPKEIQRTVDGLGPDAAAVRARLEREFAAYLDAQRKGGKLPGGPAGSAWKLFDALAAPIGAQAARRLIERFLAADPDRPPADGVAEGPAGPKP
ncbi:MAG TPA: hypothetical protein VFW92_03770 [Candidatus Limnocylindrales bacterium]|nr:hypothetical protein [Candidatus Limnocylindrales bacterium]